jgi:hypothetical protein
MGMREGHGRFEDQGFGGGPRRLRFVLALAPLFAVASVSLLLFAGNSNSAEPLAPGSWTLSNGMVTDTETNMSGQPIKAFYLVLPSGVTVTGAGSLSGVSPATCVPGEPGKKPNEVECFTPGGWPNGTKITYTFPVSDPQGKLTANPPPTFEKFVSLDGSSYKPGFGLPPATAANTPPAQGPCKCSKLTGELDHFHIFGKGTTKIEFDVDWEMTCSPGAGNCNGEILVKAPLGARFLDQNGKKFPPKDKPSIVHVKCAGPCDKTTKGRTTLSYVAFTTVKDKKGRQHTVPIPRFLPEGRANKTFEIRVSVICANPPGVVKKLKLTFDKHGQVSLKKSKVKF